MCMLLYTEWSRWLQGQSICAMPSFSQLCTTVLTLYSHQGPKPCSGTKIEKGSLRFGTVVDIRKFQPQHSVEAPFHPVPFRQHANPRRPVTTNTAILTHPQRATRASLGVTMVALPPSNSKTSKLVRVFRCSVSSTSLPRENMLIACSQQLHTMTMVRLRRG